MDPRAIEKSKSRLRAAKKAIHDLEESKTFTEFNDVWYNFLCAFKNVYTVLEQGAKASPQSRQWFGEKQKERRADDLLQYVYEARNDDEHGLGASLEFKPEMHEIGIAAPGYSKSIVLNGGPFKNVVLSGGVAAASFEGMPPPKGIQITSLDGKPVLNRYTPATVILVNVNARGNRVLSPPNSHLGNQLADTSPLGVARQAIIYLESLVADAENGSSRRSQASRHCSSRHARARPRVRSGVPGMGGPGHDGPVRGGPDRLAYDRACDFVAMTQKDEG